MWQLSTWQAVYFTIAPDGDAVAGKVALAGFSGIALGDAASVHKSMAKAGDFRMAFCWSHARRKFIKSENSEPIRSMQFIEMVAELYVIEAQAPPGPLGDEARRKLRDEQSRPIVARIKKWLLEQRFLPGSDFGKAVNYVVRNWDGLVVFLDAPALPIDNNRTERGFRGPALGRKASHRRGPSLYRHVFRPLSARRLAGTAREHHDGDDQEPRHGNLSGGGALSRTGCPPRRARRTGRTSLAVSRSLPLG